jgi:hypothetical protein
VENEMQRKFTFHFSSRITEIQTKMMLIVLLGLIVKVTLVSGDCGDGNKGVESFNLDKVGISVLIQLLKQADF